MQAFGVGAAMASFLEISEQDELGVRVRRAGVITEPAASLEGGVADVAASHWVSWQARDLAGWGWRAAQVPRGGGTEIRGRRR